MTLQEANDFVTKSSWGKPCQGLFSELVTTNPEVLLTLLEHHWMRPTLLGFAAETAGLIQGSKRKLKRVAKVLIGLLEHEKFYVREGAVYGLGQHLIAPDVRVKLEEVCKSDPSESVRLAAQEVLDG